MKFWDSSAIIPLLLEDAHTSESRKIFHQDPAMLVWWLADVECVSGISRLERMGHLSLEDAEEALDRLRQLRQHWHEVQPVEPVKEWATRLLRVHRLRAADALQLAAAFVASEGHPATLDFVCFDRLLRESAQREGFRLYPGKLRRT